MDMDFSKYLLCAANFNRLWFLYHCDMIYANFHVPDPGIQFFSGCAVFQKVYIWILHDVGNFRIQKFFRTILVWDPVFP